MNLLNFDLSHYLNICLSPQGLEGKPGLPGLSLVCVYLLKYVYFRAVYITGSYNC